LRRPLRAETARRLACDSSVVRILENEKGEPLDVGRKTRTIPPAIRRALTSRDRGCRFPGCSFRRYVDGHHVRHWADGGETKLSNLVTLCRFHHRLVHEGQAFVRTLDDGAFRFIRSNGESFDSPLPPAANGRAIVVASESAGLCIRPTTAVTNWMGEALDLDFAIETLLQLRGNGKNVPAGTSAGRAARRRARESSVP
jgi:HNH endonuclease